MTKLSSIPLLLVTLMMNPANAQSAVHSPAAESADYKAILTTASKSATEELKQKILLKVDFLNVSGNWAFMNAQMQDASGAPFNYHGTPLEAAAEAGGVSRVFAALLQKQEDHWVVRDKAVGPTDLAWESWAEDYGAPAALFAGD